MRPPVTSSRTGWRTRRRITEEVVRAEIRKAAVQKKTTVAGRGAAAPGWAGQTGGKGPDLGADPRAGSGRWRRWRSSKTGDTDGLATEAILEQARSLQEWPPDVLTGDADRASKQWRGLAGRRKSAARATPPPPPADCVRTLKRLRFDRERAAVQREIDRLQEQGAARHEAEIVALWSRKQALLQQIEALMEAG